METTRSHCRLTFVSGSRIRVRAGKIREVSLLWPQKSLSSFSFSWQICLASDTHFGGDADQTRSVAHASLRGL